MCAGNSFILKYNISRWSVENQTFFLHFEYNYSIFFVYLYYQMKVLSQRKSAKNNNKQRNSLRGGAVSPLSLVGLWAVARHTKECS